jgi:hypothetical protein
MKKKQKQDKLPLTTPVQIVRAQVKRKYGSFMRFSRLTKYPYHRMLRLTHMEERFLTRELETIIGLYNATPDRVIYGKELRPVTRAAIRDALHPPYGKYENVRDFTSHFPEFDETWISRVIHGYYRTLSPKIKLLCDVLKIKYDV